MAKKKKVPKKPPHNPDPNQYAAVKTKEGWYLRRKRGSVNGAELNRSFSINASVTKVVSPANKRIREKLEEFTRSLSTGRLHARLNRMLIPEYKQTGIIKFLQFKGFDFQEDHPFEKIMQANYKIQKDHDFIEIQIPVTKNAVRQNNRLVTHFYFEGILLYGDALQEASLKTAFILSNPYSFTGEYHDDCKLVLQLPKKDDSWMLMLRVSCLEGNEMAEHPRHYGMKVVEVCG